MKYKIGDKVRVREDLEKGKTYGHYFSEEMAKLKGKIVEIENIGSISYTIKEDGYYWSEEMFSGLAEPRNLIPQIAKELGVEIGERFIIGMPDIKFYFDDNYLRAESLDGKENDFNYDDVFINLINGKTLLNKLPPKPTLTDDERVILRNLPKEYKWICRNQNNNLILVTKEPFKVSNENSYWNCRNKDNGENTLLRIQAFNHLFQFIKWEDKKPYNIEELLKGE